MLPVTKYVIIAAKAAMGNAKRKPMTTTTTKAIMRKTITSHQNEASVRAGIMTCRGNIIGTPNSNSLLVGYIFGGEKLW